MSLDSARTQIVTAVEGARAAWTNFLVVQYDNRIAVDPQKAHDTWLDVNIMFTDAYQGDLSDQPFHRHIGIIQLAAVTKYGNGTAEGLRLLEHFYTRLQRKQFGSVRTLVMDPRPTRQHLGWDWQMCAVPFWFDVVLTA